MTQFQPAIPATRCRPPALVQVFPGGVILGACGCSSPPPAPDRLASATAAQTSTRVVPVVSSPTRPSDASETIPASGVTRVYGDTEQQPHGNRLVVGWGALPEAIAVDIRLAGQPLWVVTTLLGGGSLDRAGGRARQHQSGSGYAIGWGSGGRLGTRGWGAASVAAAVRANA